MFIACKCSKNLCNFYLFLRYLHTRHRQCVIARFANCSVDQVRYAIQEWVPKWFRVAKLFTRLTWLGDFPQVFHDLQPADLNAASNKRIEKGDTDDEFSDSDNDEDGSSNEGVWKDWNIQYVNLDGKVFLCEGFNKSHLLKRSCYSNKTSTSGLQTLVWSMPCGIPFLVTGLFAAKLSEKRQVALHSRWLVAIPPGIYLNGDRGFRNLQRHYEKFVLTMPIILF